MQHIYTEAGTISAFLSFVVSRVYVFTWVSAPVCASALRTGQPRITCHKLVLPSIANVDTETGVHAAFRGKCLEVLLAYLMRLDAVSSNAIS